VFTGIIETLGTVLKTEQEGTNLHFWVRSNIWQELKTDQSVSHNGVCLTVVETDASQLAHRVTAIYETLQKSSLRQLAAGSLVNLERCMRIDARLDGHFVQGHVDQVAQVTKIQEAGGSWYFTFAYEPLTDNVLVKKGSVCIDGTSLTVVEANNNSFSVAIIPYTYQHTLFHTYQTGSMVNLEFDIIGKYIVQLFKQYTQTNGLNIVKTKL